MTQVAILEAPPPDRNVRLEALTSALSAVESALAFVNTAIDNEEEDFYKTGPDTARKELETAHRRLVKAVPNLERAQKYIFRARRRTQGEIHDHNR